MTKTNDTTIEQLSKIIEAPKKKAKGKLAKLAQQAAPPIIPATQEEARQNLRILVVTYEDLKEMSKKCKQRAGDYRDKNTGELLRENRLPQEARAALEEMAELYDSKASSLKAHMRRQMKLFPIYTMWLRDVAGIGDCASAKLLADIDIKRATKPSSLHQVCGLGVWVDEEGKGHAQRARANEPLDFHNRLKVALSQAFGSLVKQKATRDESIYYRRYVEYKNRLQTSGRFVLLDKTQKNPRTGEMERMATFDGKPGGRAKTNDMAWRPAMQLFLDHLYLIWRSIEGLEVRCPYLFAKRGFDHQGAKIGNEWRKLTPEQALAEVATGRSLSAATVAELSVAE